MLSPKDVHLAIGIGQVFVKGDAQTVSLLEDWLTSDTAVHLATTIRQVSVRAMRIPFRSWRSGSPTTAEMSGSQRRYSPPSS